jgi:hypothetical protein
MKNLFKKSWFIGSLSIGLMLLVFLLNLWILSLELEAPYEGSIFTLASNLSDGRYSNIYAYVLRILFYLSLVPIALAVISIFKKNHFGFILAIIYAFGFGTALIIFQATYHNMSIFSIILVILSFVILVGAVVLLIIRNMILHRTVDIDQEEHKIKINQSKIPFYVLLIDSVSILVFLTTFFIPLYSLLETGSTYHAIIIRVLFSGDTHYDVIIYFLANFIIFLAIFLYFAQCLSYYFFNKEKFVKQSKSLITFSFIATIMFFLMGLTMTMYHTISNTQSQTLSFIPLLLMCFVIFTYAIFRGKFSTYYQTIDTEIKLKYARIEPLLYVILLTAVTGLMLLLNVIKIQISYGTYTSAVELTGLVILKDYAILDPGYRLVAYLLVVMLISVGLTLVIALASYLSKHKQFNAMVKLATIVNVFFVFVIAVSGYYFQIGQAINQGIILEIFELYGIELPDTLDYEYKITTDAIYALIGSVAVLMIMFMRKAFDRDELGVMEANLLSSNPSVESNNGLSTGDAYDEENYEQFDPCPAFTELDSKIDEFHQDLENRKGYKVKETSLSELTHFVVEYARNSRLHLSYTPEDIATFVAGLGASRLSILQGMSGTGKTSLPKIFSEAIFGNCEIIEVESSWKDKNELLGYYNEFSMKYTPKKFTIALYKAALNQEIVTFILLDEMNLSRIEYYFSDFLSLMENEENYREIKLININLSRKEDGENQAYKALVHGNTLKVPSNVWFIGTANRDESTFVISDKVYDRAHTMNFTKRAPKVRNYSNPMSKQYFDYETIQNLFEQAKQKGNFDAENSELIKQVEGLLAPYNISFGNRILKQIEDFVNIYKECFPNEDVEHEAIEKILLSKVVAKLEVKTIDDKEKLEMEFEKLNLNQCTEFIKRLDNE